MNLYGNDSIASVEEIANSNALMELFLVDDILHSSKDQIKEFCESAEAQVLVEKAVLNKPMLVRISKEADFKRRVKLTAYHLAKDAKDPLWDKLVKYHGLKKQFAQKILTKYGKKAERIAKISQKKYIQKAKSMKATKSEQKAQAATS